MAKQRITWIDAAKGLLMLLVVIGHYPRPTEAQEPFITYIYWLHMPAFFILSGVFFKTVAPGESVKKAIKKRFMQLIVPYISFLFIIMFLRYAVSAFYGEADPSVYFDDFSNLWALFFGGRFVTGSFGAFWFVPVLFVSYIIFILITRYLNIINQILFLITCYLLAQNEGYYNVRILEGKTSITSQEIPVPWDLDVCLLAIVYIAVGYYLKKLFLNVHWSLWIMCFGLVCTAIFMHHTGAIKYYFSMKYLRYSHPVLNLLIPVSITFVYLGIIQFITKYIRLRPFEFIEKHSIFILYMHLFIFKVVKIIIPDYNWITLTVISITIPILCSMLAKVVFPYGQFLLYGNIYTKRPFPFNTKLFNTK